MPLFKPEKIAPRGPAGRWDVVVGEEMCKACGFCLHVCPVDVFAWRTTPNRLGWFPMVVAKEANCVGCMLCYQICPDFCIDVAVKGTTPAGNATTAAVAVRGEAIPIAEPSL
ncbi:MAG TPA: 4Fe-4S dicluster domain-containing protein [Methylomirabilota bacterium]